MLLIFNPLILLSDYIIPLQQFASLGVRMEEYVLLLVIVNVQPAMMVSAAEKVCKVVSCIKVCRSLSHYAVLSQVCVISYGVSMETASAKTTVHAILGGRGISAMKVSYLVYNYIYIYLYLSVTA